QVSVHVAYHLFDGRLHRAWIGLGPDHDREEADRELIECDVRRGIVRLRQVLSLHVLHDADDRAGHRDRAVIAGLRRVVADPVRDHPADRVLVREIPLHELHAHDHGSWHIVTILRFGKQAAAHERNAHGGEIPGRRRVHLSDVTVLWRRGRPAFDFERRADETAVVQRTTERAAYGSSARKL